MSYSKIIIDGLNKQFGYLPELNEALLLCNKQKTLKQIYKLSNEEIDMLVSQIKSFNLINEYGEYISFFEYIEDKQGNDLGFAQYYNFLKLIIKEINEIQKYYDEEFLANKSNQLLDDFYKQKINKIYINKEIRNNIVSKQQKELLFNKAIDKDINFEDIMAEFCLVVWGKVKTSFIQSLKQKKFEEFEWFINKKFTKESLFKEMILCY